MNNEKNIHLSICTFIRRFYPDVVFTSDASGLRVTRGMQMLIKQTHSSRGIPDLILLHPSGGFHGLTMEIKSNDVVIYRRDGELVADKHIREQSEMLTRLRNVGFAAFFCCGFDRAISCFQNYVTNTVYFDIAARSHLVWDNNVISIVHPLNQLKTAKI